VFSVVQFMMLHTPPHFLLHTKAVLMLDVLELQSWFTEVDIFKKTVSVFKQLLFSFTVIGQKL
jgi:hypothetical protein